MASDSAPRHPLRDQAAVEALDAGTPMRMLVGIVTARQITTAPYTVTVQLADGAIVGPITYLGWYSPTVNDVVVLARAGARIICLGAEAPTRTVTTPHRHAAADIDGTIIAAPPAPGTPPPAPPAPPTVRTVSVAPADMAYFGSFGWKRDGSLIQGGPNNRAFWFYGGGIAAAKGAGTITGGSIVIQRETTSHGVNGAANVRLGVHAFGTQPGSGAAALGAVDVQAQLGRGQLATVPLSAAQIANLNAGMAGLGLEPGGSSYTSADYLRATTGGASGQLSLTVLG